MFLSNVLCCVLLLYVSLLGARDRECPLDSRTDTETDGGTTEVNDSTSDTEYDKTDTSDSDVER